LDIGAPVQLCCVWCSCQPLFGIALYVTAFVCHVFALFFKRFKSHRDNFGAAKAVKVGSFLVLLNQEADRSLSRSPL